MCDELLLYESGKREPVARIREMADGAVELLDGRPAVPYVEPGGNVPASGNLPAILFADVPVTLSLASGFMIAPLSRAGTGTGPTPRERVRMARHPDVSPHWTLVWPETETTTDADMEAKGWEFGIFELVPSPPSTTPEEARAIDPAYGLADPVPSPPSPDAVPVEGVSVAYVPHGSEQIRVMRQKLAEASDDPVDVVLVSAPASTGMAVYQRVLSGRPLARGPLAPRLPCWAPSPQAGRECKLPSGHDGPHMSGGQSW